MPAPPGIPPPGPGGEDSASQTSTSTSDPSGDDGDRKARRYFHFLKEIDEGKKRRRALRRRRNSSDSSGSGATQSSDAKKPGPGGAPKAAAKARAGHVGHDEIVTWDLPHSMGRIKFEKHRERFGAHCPLGGTDIVDGVHVPRPHGPGACRLNRVAWKHPAGLFGAWLLCADEFPDQQAHYAEAKVLSEHEGFDARLVGRRFVEGVEDVADLISAEGGDWVEPVRVP